MTDRRLVTPAAAWPRVSLMSLSDIGYARLRFAVDLFTVLVIATLAVASARLVWRVTGYDDGRTEVAVATFQAAPAATDVATVLLLSPFGAPAGVAVAGAGTASGLVLRGTVVAAPASTSSAVIADANGSAATYLVGQALPGGAVLAGVERDRVTLRTGAGEEILAFPQPTAAPPTTAQTPVVGVPVPPAATVASPAVVAPPPPRPASLAPPLSTPSIGALGATPEAGGWRVGAGVSAQVLAAGLRPGDLVERVNGAPLGDPVRDRTVMEQAVASGRAQVDVMREGRRITLTVPLR